MKKIILFSLCVWSFSSVLAQSVKLDFTIKGMRDSVVILGYYNGEKLSVQDSLKLDNKGRTSIKSKEPLPHGKYFLYLTPSKRFDLLLGNNQKFQIVADTSNLLDIKVTGSKENELFYAYIKFIQDKIEQRQKLQTNYKSAKTEAEKKKISDQFEQLNKEVKTYMDQQIANNPNTFFAKQLKSTFDVEIPAEMKKRNNREEMYHYYRAHYFDNIDFGEPGLSRTNNFPKKIDDYLSKYIPQIPDSIYPHIDMLIKKSRAHNDMFKFMIMHLHDLYVTSENLEMENVYVWLLDKYFIPEVDWMDEEFLKRVKKKSKDMKPLLIGQPAPEISMELYDEELHSIFSNLIRLSRENDDLTKEIKEAKSDVAKLKKRQAEVTDSLNKLNETVSQHPKRKIVKLRDVKAKYTILAFWEPECSHCKKAIPALHAKYTETLKSQGIEVYAACTQLKPNVWGEFLTKHKLFDWTNVWDPYNNSKFRDKYDIHSTPQIFILDADKNILLKKVAVEHLDEAFKYLKQRYEK